MKVNGEESIESPQVLIAAHPRPKTLLPDEEGHRPALERERGCLSERVECFGTLDDRSLVGHTKTWNTSGQGLRHNGWAIFVWSLSGET